MEAKQDLIRAIRFSWWLGFFGGVVTGVFMTLVILKFH